MNELLKVTKTSRKITNSFLEGYTLEQLNTIPEGFTNNLFWNIAHIVITQQLLVYKLSGLPMKVSDGLVEKYRKGAKCEGYVSKEEVALFKSLIFETIEQTENDLKNNLFQNFTEYPTSTGFIIKNLEDALTFNNFHEGIHIGVMMSIKKFI